MSYVESSNLHELISRLNDTNKEICHEPTLDIFRSVDAKHKETLITIGSSVECGYRYLTALEEKKLTDLCKYLNLWLNEKKRTYVNSGITEGEWQTVENLWKTLMQGEFTDHKCEREHEEKDISEYSKRIDLLSYCINRDYFKSFFHSSGVSDNYKKNICKGFSDYTSEYYDQLVAGIKCIDNKNGNKDYKYHISDDCTLYNIPKTFPTCEEHTPTFVRHDNSKTDIERCKITEQVESRDTETGKSLAEPTERNGALDNHPETADEPAERLETAGGPVKLPEAAGAPTDLIQFNLPSQTELTSSDNGTSKTIYYSGLSVSGVFFTSMVLYKYTTLGPLIRSLVSKKEKLRQTTNKHLAEQWLQTTSEYMDSNSENAHYNFPYQSMQN